MNIYILDCELYKNYFLVELLNIKTREVKTIEVLGGNRTLSAQDASDLKQILLNDVTMGYNSTNYDLPVLFYILRIKSVADVFKMSQYIIDSGAFYWDVCNKYSFRIPSSLHHYDLMKISPSIRTSLKLIGGRLDCENLQDLPFEINMEINKKSAKVIREYCRNDLELTELLYAEIKDRVKLRSQLSKLHRLNLYSKSDAQIAEALFKSKVGNIPKPNKIEGIVKYKTPKFVDFEGNKELSKLVKELNRMEFKVSKVGKILLPTELKNRKIVIGKSNYKIGIGGIHSLEKSKTVIPNKNQYLIDQDVAAYYPFIILVLGLFPKHIGPIFSKIYKGFVDERLEAKETGNKLIDKSFKIVINGIFGKFMSQYSVFYSPESFLAVTITGQLCLLMIINELEENGIQVVSANTDGFVSLMDKSKKSLFDKISKQWEKKTKFVLEKAEYQGLFSRDVNNYLAIINSENRKGKGIFSNDYLSKNQQGRIIVESVIKFLSDKKPIEKTIRECKDITKFIFIRTVKGGGRYKGEYLGKVVRWVYVIGGDNLRYKNGNKVPKSDSSYPVMDFIFGMPSNLDYDRYIVEANKMLEDIGYF